MNLTSVNQQLTSSVTENSVSTNDLKAIKDRIKQLRANAPSTTTQSKSESDTVQISSTGSDLSSVKSASSSESMVATTDVRSEEKRVSSGGIDNVMARYKEAQSFMEQIEHETINSTV
jgi:hypothetical protein